MVDLKTYFWQIQKGQIDIDLLSGTIEKKEKSLRESELYRLIRRQRELLRKRKTALAALIREAPLE